MWRSTVGRAPISYLGLTYLSKNQKPGLFKLVFLDTQGGLFLHPLLLPVSSCFCFCTCLLPSPEQLSLLLSRQSWVLTGG